MPQQPDDKKIFDTILSSGVRAGQIPNRTQKAREWFRNTARLFGSRTRQGGSQAGRVDYGKINERQFTQSTEPGRLVQQIEPGSMYMYYYDPKLKDTLPYYDRFPLMFPFRVESDRFWGINLHYVDLRARAILMDSLYTLVNNTKYDKTTQLQLSYATLQRASQTKIYKPCIKQYLRGHVSSSFIYVHPSEWDTALFLPLERFEKKSKSQVFSISSKAY